MNKFFIALCVIFAIYACSGGRDSNQIDGSLLRPALSSSIDLRLGQLSSGSSPVAVSAALENNENIVVFSNSDSANFEVVYVSPSQETILVNFDQTGRPQSARTDNLLISFDNYTKENTVDVTIQSLLGVTAQTQSIFLPTLQIDPNVVLFLEGDTMLKILLGIDQDIDSATRALLAAAFGALKLVSCDASEFTSSFANLFSESFSSKLCSSDLLDLIEKILENSNYQNINVNLTNRYPECDLSETYEEKKACSLAIQMDLVEAVKQKIVGNYPKNNDNGSTTGGDTGGSSTGSTTGSDTGDSSTGSTTGGDTGGNSTGGTTGGSTGGNSTGGGGGGGGGNGFLTNWAGKATVGGNNPFCSDIEIKFAVTGNSDCDPFCNFTGFFKDISDPAPGAPMNGIVDRNGVIRSNNGEDVVIMGLLNSTTGTGISDFTYTSHLCTVLGVNVQLTDGFLGHWTGGGAGTSPCGNFNIRYDVRSAGDHSCSDQACTIAGSLEGFNGFPIMTTDVMGTVNGDGISLLSNGVQTLPSNASFSASGTIQGNILDNPKSFIALPGPCPMQFMITKD